MNSRIHGLLAAPHTPFAADGPLNLRSIELQAERFCAQGLPGVFVGGTTGEVLSLTCDERIRLSERWLDIGRQLGLRVIVHVGANCLSEAEALAKHAQRHGADGIAAFAPSFYRPETVDSLVDYCQRVAQHAPETDFYFYHIPSMTGVDLPMREFLVRGAQAIPSLRGLKFSHADMVQEIECVRFDHRRFGVFHGLDETLLAALAIGVRSAVGCTYNFAAPLYQRMIQAFAAHDLELARNLQEQSVVLVQTLCEFGFIPASKVAMEFIGIDCGPVRPPLRALMAEDRAKLRKRLEAIGFFEWIG